MTSSSLDRTMSSSIVVAPIIKPYAKVGRMLSTTCPLPPASRVQWSAEGMDGTGSEEREAHLYGPVRQRDAHNQCVVGEGAAWRMGGGTKMP